MSEISTIEDESTLDFTKEAPPSYKIKLPDGTVYESDPITVSIAFERAGFSTDGGSSPDSTESMVKKIREVFKAPALTDAQAIAVMMHFKVYVERLQKKIASTPISSTHTEPHAGNIPPACAPPSGSKFPAMPR